eukprot:s4232_g5.t1
MASTGSAVQRYLMLQKAFFSGGAKEMPFLLLNVREALQGFSVSSYCEKMANSDQSLFDLWLGSLLLTIGLSIMAVALRGEKQRVHVHEMNEMVGWVGRRGCRRASVIPGSCRWGGNCPRWPGPRRAGGCWHGCTGFDEPAVLADDEGFVRLRGGTSSASHGRPFKAAGCAAAALCGLLLSHLHGSFAAFAPSALSKQRAGKVRLLAASDSELTSKKADLAERLKAEAMAAKKARSKGFAINTQIFEALIESFDSERLGPVEAG